MPKWAAVIVVGGSWSVEGVEDADPLAFGYLAGPSIRASVKAAARGIREIAILHEPHWDGLGLNNEDPARLRGNHTFRLVRLTVGEGGNV
jgi:hypothetical protein